MKFPDQQHSRRSLVEALIAGMSPSARDKGIIGELLMTMHETESRLDEALTKWVMPFPDDQGRKTFIDEFLVFTDLSRKIAFSKAIGLIGKKERKLFLKLTNLRNALAHPRPEGKRPYQIFGSGEVRKFKEEAKQIQEHIQAQVGGRLVISRLQQVVKAYEGLKIRIKKIQEANEKAKQS